MRSSKLSQRRRFLKGMLAGSAVTVGLPLLDCFLNTNGDALAATDSSGSTKLPVCFGTWFWGLGLSQGFWEPKTTGQNYELPEQIAVLAPFKDRINVFSGLQANLDGKINATHFSGAQAIATGMVTATPAGYSTSLDAGIADNIGKRTRFRSLEVTCDGNPKSSWSARGINGVNPAETSPLALYTRIFGSDFRDPNAAEFVPSAEVMVRKSALSAVMEERDALLADVGASDRRRIDEYFSSVRDLETKLAIELEKPAPMAACTKPPQIKDAPTGRIIDDALQTHDLFATLIAHALACGQTRVFNSAISEGMSGLRMPGDTTNHHIYTHEEPLDAKLGYQPKCYWFAQRYMASFKNFLATLDSIKEGSQTLLDRTLVFAFTDHGEARLHGLQNYPFFTAGRAGGQIKTGFHIAAPNQPVTRLGLTVQQVMGLPVDTWGTESNRVTRAFTELLA